MSGLERLRQELQRRQEGGRAPLKGLDRLRAERSRREQQANRPGVAETGVRSAVQGLTFGGGDELVAAAAAPVRVLMGAPSLREAYEHGLRTERRVLREGREDNPVTATAAEIGGAIASPVAKLGQARTVAGGIAKGAGLGAAYGGLSAEGGARQRAQGAGVGAGFGAAGGGLGTAVANRIQGAVAGRQASRALDEAAAGAPTTGDLRRQSGQLFDSARARGVAVTGESFQGLVNGVEEAVTELGIDRTVTPRAFATLRRLRQSGDKDMTFREIETLRRVANNAVQSNEPQERMIAGRMVEAIDDYLANLVDADLAQGTVAGLSDDLKQARALWRNMRNSEMIEQAIEAAQNARSGFENGLRVEFGKIQRNKRLWRQLSDGEKEAINAVVRGDARGNFLRRLSRLGFGEGSQHNMLGATAGIGVGGLTMGPLGGIAVPVAGQLAGRAAERATLRAAERARGVAAAGGLTSLPARVRGPGAVRGAGPFEALRQNVTE